MIGRIMKKTIFALATVIGFAGHAQAATLSSVTCSLDTIVLTFDQTIVASDVTKIEIGETSTAKLKYEISTSSAVSGATLTLTNDTAAKKQIRKVSPFKAHIYATGNASGVAKCNG